jgi:2-amino-4-hydroxy-6-hydroxymethyldihydropteridine diphosphokinase
MTTAYIALGSNLGDRLAHLKRAVLALDGLESTTVDAVSPVYETEALTPDDSEGPPYLNAVARLVTDLEPRTLLARCLAVERDEGRSRTPERRWESRTLDLDILTWDDLSVRTDSLTIPHPEMRHRRFVLRPLCDLAPDLHLPDPYDVSVRYLLSQCTDRGAIRKLDEDLSLR